MVGSMELDAFMAKARRHLARTSRDPERLRIMIYDYSDEEGGGFRIDCGRGCAFGDTIEEALLAAYDSLTGAPSRHARMNAPDRMNGQVVTPARHVKYDYRTKDWAPKKGATIRIRYLK